MYFTHYLYIQINRISTVSTPLPPSQGSLEAQVHHRCGVDQYQDNGMKHYWNTEILKYLNMVSRTDLRLEITRIQTCPCHPRVESCWEKADITSINLDSTMCNKIEWYFTNKPGFGMSFWGVSQNESIFPRGINKVYPYSTPKWVCISSHLYIFSGLTDPPSPS